MWLEEVKIIYDSACKILFPLRLTFTGKITAYKTTRGDVIHKTLLKEFFKIPESEMLLKRWSTWCPVLSNFSKLHIRHIWVHQMNGKKFFKASKRRIWWCSKFTWLWKVYECKFISSKLRPGLIILLCSGNISLLREQRCLANTEP